MSNTGTVQEYKKSESGRTKVKIDGQWYNAGNGVDIGPSTVSVGTRISFDSSSKDWNGKPVWWLNKYGALPASSNGVHADPAAPRNNATHVPTTGFSTAPYAIPGAPPTTPTGSLDEPMRQTCSNIIANLARAGTLKSPDELDVWLAAIKAAFSGKTRQPGEDDEF